MQEKEIDINNYDTRLALIVLCRIAITLNRLDMEIKTLKTKLVDRKILQTIIQKKKRTKKRV